MGIENPKELKPAWMRKLLNLLPLHSGYGIWLTHFTFLNFQISKTFRETLKPYYLKYTNEWIRIVHSVIVNIKQHCLWYNVFLSAIHVIFQRNRGNKRKDIKWQWRSIREHIPFIHSFTFTLGYKSMCNYSINLRSAKL
jgi:hypothetical protein